MVLKLCFKVRMCKYLRILAYTGKKDKGNENFVIKEHLPVIPDDAGTFDN